MPYDYASQITGEHCGLSMILVKVHQTKLIALRAEMA